MNISEETLKGLLELPASDIVELIDIIGTTSIHGTFDETDKIILAVAMMNHAITTFESVGGMVYASFNHMALSEPIDYMSEDTSNDFGDFIG